MELDMTQIVTQTQHVLTEQLLIWQPEHPLWAGIAPLGMLVIAISLLVSIVSWLRAMAWQSNESP